MTDTPDHQPIDNASLHRRLTELESHYTHLQRTTEDLSDVLLAQGRLIQTLQRELERVAHRTDALESSVESPRRAEDERPPHY